MAADPDGLWTLDTNRCSWSDEAYDEHTFGIWNAGGRTVSPVVAPAGAPRVEPRRRHTAYQRPESWAPAFRPGGPGERRVGAPAGHRARPIPSRCDNPRASARAAAVRRRHILLGIVALASVIALAVPWGTKPDHALAAPAVATSGAALARPSVYTVQAGDTLVSIAQRIEPRGDRRALTSELSAQIGGGGVRPGERLVLP